MDASGFLSLFNSVLHFSDFVNINLFLYCDCDGRKETGACPGLCCLKEKEVFCFVTFCGWCKPKENQDNIFGTIQKKRFLKKKKNHISSNYLGIVPNDSLTF